MDRGKSEPSPRAMMLTVQNLRQIETTVLDLARRPDASPEILEAAAQINAGRAWATQSELRRAQ